MKFKPIQAKRFEEVKYFRSIRACAKALEIHSARATRAVKYHIPVNGWTITEFEGDASEIAELGNANSMPVIAITQDGTRVFFSSIDNASYCLKCASSSIQNVLKGRKPTLGGWKWIYANGDNSNTVEYTDKIGCSFEVFKHTSCKQQFSKPPKAIEDEIEEEDHRFDNRKVLCTGFYDPEYFPTICPICGEVVCSDIKNEDNKGSRHLTKCLKGRDYSIKNGLITVYKPL